MFQQAINEAQVLENWAPMIEERTGIKESNKLQWMSKYCHYHAINESFAYSSVSTLGNVPGMGAVRPGSAPGGPVAFHTGSTGSGDKFPSLLPLSIQVAARTVGFDIVSVIPMPGPAGVLTYLDYIYSGGKLGSEDKPLIFKVFVDDKGGISTGDFVNGAKYWGVNQPQATAFATSDKAVELIYVGKSRIDASAIFRVGSTYNFTGSTNTLSAVNNNIALAEIFNTVTTVITNDNGGKPSLGVKDATSVTNTVTARAELVKALEDHIQGYAGAGTYDQDNFTGDSISGSNPANPMGRATGENTYYRMMGLTAFTKFVEAETFQVAAGVTTEQIQDLNKQFGIDVVSMVENALVNEISQNINKHILTRAFALGWSNNSNMYKVANVTMNFSVDPAQNTATSATYYDQVGSNTTIAVNKYADYGNFENLSTIQRRIKSKILAAGNIIAQRGRRGPGNFAVTNIQIATALQDVAQYTFSPMTNSINQNNGSLYPIGSVAGVTIYVDPYMDYNDNRILVGRKGGDEEPGLKFMPYLMAESIQTIAENTMAPKIAVKSRYALVEAGFHPEQQYYTFFVHVGSTTII